MHISSLIHHESTPVGLIQSEYEFEPEEICALKFLLSDSKDVTHNFLRLWDSIDHYENATFGVKEMMPTIVNKLQRMDKLTALRTRLNQDYFMLLGLPKYTWTKNIYARNQLKIIKKTLHENNIPFILLKGIAETFLNPDALNTRTCRDIDILIKPDDINLFNKVANSIGWRCPDLDQSNNLNSFEQFALNAFTFRNSDHIIDLDVHFGGAQLNWSANTIFVDYIWKQAVMVDSTNALLVPNMESRLLLSAWNLFDIENMKSHQMLKYLYDFMLYVGTLSTSEKLKFVLVAHTLLNFGNEVLHLLRIESQVQRRWGQYIFFTILMSTVWLKLAIFKIQVSEERYYRIYYAKTDISPITLTFLQYRAAIISKFYRLCVLLKAVVTSIKSGSMEEITKSVNTLTAVCTRVLVRLGRAGIRAAKWTTPNTVVNAHDRTADPYDKDGLCDDATAIKCRSDAEHNRARPYRRFFISINYIKN
jgi:hypothetical protein